MIDGRLEAGAPSRAEAERAVLVELGDPVRLAAGYSGRPLLPHRAEASTPSGCRLVTGCC